LRTLRDAPMITHRCLIAGRATKCATRREALSDRVSAEPRRMRPDSRPTAIRCFRSIVETRAIRLFGLGRLLVPMFGGAEMKSRAWRAVGDFVSPRWLVFWLGIVSACGGSLVGPGPADANTPAEASAGDAVADAGGPDSAAPRCSSECNSSVAGALCLPSGCSGVCICDNNEWTCPTCGRCPAEEPETGEACDDPDNGCDYTATAGGPVTTSCWCDMSWSCSASISTCPDVPPSNGSACDAGGPNQVLNSTKSLITHAVYGLGLYLAALVTAGG
jgi:hypothetical protein